MQYKYGDMPTEQIQAQKRYLYGSIIDLLYRQEAGYPLLDARIQSLINQINGLNSLFGYPPQIVTIISCLEDARIHPEQFRKNVLDAANLIDTIAEVSSDV